MGLFQSIFGKEKPQIKEVQNGYQMLNGYTPMFSPFNRNIYESELIRAAIDSRARHIAKLKVEIQGAAKPTLQTKLRHAPNNFQTWSQFLYRLSTILDINNTAIIVPVIDQYGEVSGVYPILPNSIELVQFKGEPVLRCKFTNGQVASILLKECGIMTKFQYKNDFFGETNQALNPLLELLHIQNQGIEEGVKSAATYRFMAQLGNLAKETDLAKERKRFSETNLREGGGLLLFPSTYMNIKQVDAKPYVPDANTMKLIESKVFNYYGVGEKVLRNEAYGDEWSAFYEGAIEPFAIQFSEVLTKMLFTQREIAQGSLVMATSNRLQYMSTNDKLNVSSQLADRGILNRDEVREIWNLPPLPNGEGQDYIIRGEYYNSKDKITEGESDE